ncbi:hypothetical protein [Streptomyces sp. NBC_01190]|uniref:hypothetical protein n=1 Tax=Streptomyces sp. NBC_01190 TaxID=2903767 RepID=UPI0038706AF6|nr:hypothetical protein OG519_30935 [Streptomyces sp. NBC_01190]
MLSFVVAVLVQFGHHHVRNGMAATLEDLPALVQQEIRYGTEAVRSGPSGRLESRDATALVAGRLPQARRPVLPQSAGAPAPEPARSSDTAASAAGLPRPPHGAATTTLRPDPGQPGPLRC